MIKNFKRSNNLIQAAGRRLFYCAALLVVFAAWSAVGVTNANGQSFTEGFDVVPVPGWTTQNNSVPVGTTNWFQGNPATFPSHMGADTSYIGANFNNTTGTNTISNWLITPNRTFSNGDVITFFTRTVTPGTTVFPDRLQVRLSTNGTSTNVGTGATAVGDFTTLLLDINPNYSSTGYPTVWTQQTITISGLSAPTSGRIAFRYFVEGGGPTGINSNFIGIDTFSYTANTTPPMTTRTRFDFDGDGKADVSVFRSSSNNWFVQGSTSGFTAFNFGASGDTIVPGDYDGDNKTDYAVFRPSNSTWYVQRSTAGFSATPFGTAGDIPAPGDFDGDGKTDVAVFRPSNGTWYINGSMAGFSAVPFGSSSDKPVNGDYDGDGKSDVAVFRPSNNTWYIQGSTAGFSATPFGSSGDKLVPANYDGDTKTDIAVFRPSNGTWYVQGSTAGFSATPFGLSTDVPVAADYDGDGKADVAVFRPSNGTWYINRSTAGFSAVPFGVSSDTAVPSAYVR